MPHPVSARIAGEWKQAISLLFEVRLVRIIRSSLTSKALLCLFLPLISACSGSNTAVETTGDIGFDTGSNAAFDLFDVDDLINLKDIDSISVSPDGKKVAFQVRQADPENRRYRNEWYMMPTNGMGKPVFLGDAGDPLIFQAKNDVKSGFIFQKPAVWSRDNRAIAYPVLINDVPHIGVTEVRTQRQSVASATPARLPEIRWSADGSVVFFQSDPTIVNEYMPLDQAEADKGFLYDERFIPFLSPLPLFERPFDPSDFRETITPEEELAERLVRFDVSQGDVTNGSRTDVEDYKALQDPNDASRLARDIGVSQKLVLMYDARFFWLAKPVFLSTEKRGLAWVDLVKSEDPAQLPDVQIKATVELNAEEQKSCEAAECKGLITGLWGAGDGKTVVFQRTRKMGEFGPRLAFYKWEVGTLSPELIHTTEGRYEQCEQVETSLICLFEDTTQPRKIVALDLLNGRQETVFDPNEELSSVRWGHVEHREWRNEYGDHTLAHIVYPPDFDDATTYPLVVVTYNSGGFLRGGTGDEYPIHPLAAEGMIVVSYNASLQSSAQVFSNNDDGTTKEVSTASQSLDSNVASIDQIIDELIEEGNVDDQRMAITGLSRGSSIAHHAVIYSRHDFRTSIMSGSSTSPMNYYTGGDRHKQSYKTLLGLETPGGATDDLWEYLSPDYNVDKFNLPMLYNVSNQEFLLATQFISLMEAAEKPIEAYVFPKEYHIKYWPQHRSAIYSRNIQWLQFWLQDQMADDPVSADQYERWRATQSALCARTIADEDGSSTFCKN